MTTNSATSVSLGNAIATPATFDGAERDAQRLGQADQQRGDEGARDRAQAADDGDDERFGDDREVHAEVGGLARQLQRTGEAREKRAEREHRGEQAPLVDAERRRQHAVLGRGADQHAEARAREQSATARAARAGRRRAGGGRKCGIARPKTVDGAGEARGTRAEQVLRTPERERGIAHDQHDAEGRRELQQLGRRVDALQQQDLDQRADRSRRRSAASSTPPQKPQRAMARSPPTSVYAIYAPSM